MGDVVNIKEDDVQVPRILICIPCGYERHYWIAPQLMEFLVNLQYNSNYATLVSKAYNFIPAAAARNFVADRVLKIEPAPDWLLMIDADMGPPDNLLDAIKGAPEDASIVVPKFHLWDGDAGLTKLCWGIPQEKAEDIGDGVKGFKLDSKFYEISKCGTGAIFIKPDVFKKLSAPWFEYKHDSLGNMVATEDITFCEKVIAAGLKIYGNPTITVSHFHTMDIAKVNQVLNKKYEEAK